MTNARNLNPDPGVPLNTRVFRFNDFQFSVRQQELRKGGFRVRLSASQIRLLSLFLEQPGELITREQIAGRIWSNTATIDVTSGMNTAINRLRVSLGDNSASPHYLETVIGLGYRFIAHVEQVDEESEVAFSPRHGSEERPGLQLLPQRLVDSPLKLDSHSPERHRGSLRWALWSAIALMAMAGLSFLFYVSRESGSKSASPAQKLIPVSRVTSNSGGKQITAAALSADGKLLAYADASGIRVQTLANRQESSLGTLPTSGVTYLSWFPNSDKLAVSGWDVNTKLATVWLISSSGVATSVLATGAALGTVSPDGNRVAYTRADGSEVWVNAHDGLSTTKLLQAEKGKLFSFLLWSPDGKRLMVVSHATESGPAGTPIGDFTKPLILERRNSARKSGASTLQPGHWAWDSVDGISGKMLAHGEGTPMISAVISPSGYLLFVTASPHGTALEKGNVFAVQTDPTTGRFLRAPEKQNQFASHNLTAISSTQDGTKLAFIAITTTADVLTGSLRNDSTGGLNLTELHRLTSNLADTYPHAWAPDGTIIYETRYEKHLAIFGQKLEAPPSLLAHLPIDAAMPQITPDARWIVFIGLEQGSNSVYRVPVIGGLPERVPGAGGDSAEISCARRGQIACVLLRKGIENGTAERQYFALDPVTGLGKLLARTPWVASRRGGWSLSPDGSTVVVANRDAVHPALKLLKLNGDTPSEQVIPLSGHNAPLGAGWSPDGKTLFIETRTADAFALLSMKVGDQPKVIREFPSLVWAVPSPDGKQIGFPESTVNANVWVSASQEKTRWIPGR